MSASSPMKYALWSLVALVAIVALITIVGWSLPVDHIASRSASFAAPPEAVYAAITDVANHPTWRSNVTRVELLDTNNGKVRFREHSSNGPIVMEIDEATPPSRVVTRIADPEQPFGGTWTFEIARVGTGSTLAITERGEVYNPIFRFMARFVFGYTAGMEEYLEALKRRLARS